MVVHVWKLMIMTLMYFRRRTIEYLMMVYHHLYVWCYGAPRVEVDDYDVDVFQTEDDRIPDDGAVWCYGAPRVDVDDNDVDVFQTFRRRTIEYLVMVLFGAMVLHVVMVQLKIPVDNSNQAGRKQRARNNKHKRNKLADGNGKILCCK